MAGHRRSGPRWPFGLRYLCSELLRRARRTLLSAAGLGLGVGLVMVVSAVSAGADRAQSSVLRSLYGVGTQLTVDQPMRSVGALQDSSHALTGTLEPLPPSQAATISALPHVAAASGGLQLAELTQSGALFSRTRVDGVDPAQVAPGPLAAADVVAGRMLAAADTTRKVAVLDGGYATAQHLSVGSTVTVAGAPFEVVGIVKRSQEIGSADVYLPLAAAQTLARAPDGRPFADRVNVVYAAADSASHVADVQRAIVHLLPTATVTGADAEANAVTGSLRQAADLIGELGTWVAAAALTMASVVAGLFIVGGVAARLRELGTLKALGWPAGRIAGQVIGESAAIGVLGAIAGAIAGLAGIALVGALAPTLSATVPQDPQSIQSSTVAVHLAPHADAALIAGAALLAVLGGVLGGAVAAWRAARLQPAVAFTRIA
ncbi:ABC transporter permease [Catenulispora yoronensis]|uniref:ABC transporter permease n=1 Tax=Catenulispora yoronensis TaxID=450799 RepID=A0ABP5FM95_9ACTN